MSKIPLPAGEAILTGVEWRYIAVTGLLQAAVTLSVFVWALKARNLEEARNLAFTVLVFGELFRAFAARDPNRPFWELGVFSNLPLFGVVVSSALLQIAIHHIPAAQSLLRIRSLSTTDCLLSIAIGMVPLGVLEGIKLVKRARSPRTGGHDS